MQTAVTAFDLRAAQFPQELPLVRSLFEEYAQSLGIDLCFQNFADELRCLPGKYQVPQGALLLAWEDGQALGCVAMRPVDHNRCEMKRLYVRPEARGRQLGLLLAQQICVLARNAGYRQICLDTLPSMLAARQLYDKLGFKPVAPYVYNPIDGVIFLGLDL